ncbi:MULTISPECIES: hypothetical protein [Streptomyces]|uniref:Uncharacterized protein n=1 Tax=Streptomyces eurythermus TaxID=42237 RepID=A0ABW6YQV5_9ACTN|nr:MULTISPECIES: hypothetical protein [Streptomyces]QIS72243.1 hypothetical protein HB370_21580 [Streptomyces sp. DSM 40868]WDM14984.1 hypothetical protein J3S85_27820 [Streptomyces lavenduligriseus]
MGSRFAGLIGIVTLAVVFGTAVAVHDSEAATAGKSVRILATNEGPGTSPR